MLYYVKYEYFKFHQFFHEILIYNIVQKMRDR